MNATWETVAGVIATTNATNQGAAIAATTLFTPTSADFYMACGYLGILTAGTSGTITLNVIYQSEAGAKTTGIVSGLSITASPNANGNCIGIFAVGGTAVQYNTVLSGTAGALQYSVSVKMIKL